MWSVSFLFLFILLIATSDVGISSLVVYTCLDGKGQRTVVIAEERIVGKTKKAVILIPAQPVASLREISDVVGTLLPPLTAAMRPFEQIPLVAFPYFSKV